MDETRITGRLANLDIEIVSRKAEGGDGETVSIRMTAQPGFEEAARALLPGLAPLAANPLLGMMAGAAQGGNPLAANPMSAWMQMAQAAWQPWLSLMQANPFLANHPLLPRKEGN